MMARKARLSPDSSLGSDTSASPHQSPRLGAGGPIAPSLSQPITKVIQSDTYKTIYSNFSKVSVTQWDFAISFGQIVETKDAETVCEETISVRFSPQYFKAMIASLTGALQQWESTFGPLEAGLGQEGNAAGMAKVFDTLKDALGGINKKQGD